LFNHKPIPWIIAQNRIHPNFRSLRDGLVGHWPIWEGSARNIQELVGTNPTVTDGTFQSRPRWVPTGLDFAEDDQITFGDINSVLETSQGCVCIRIQKKVAGQTTGADPIFFLGNNGSNDNLYRLTFRTSDDNFQILLKTTSDIYRGTVTIPDDGLEKLIVVGSNAAGNKVYVNGIEQTVSYTSGSSTTTGWFSSITHNVLVLGGSKPLSEQFYNGVILDLRLYNRLLFPSEILLLATYPYGDMTPSWNPAIRRTDAVGVTGPLAGSLQQLGVGR